MGFVEREPHCLANYQAAFSMLRNNSEPSRDVGRLKEHGDDNQAWPLPVTNPIARPAFTRAHPCRASHG